ncbi:MAG: C25 family cysteine peptidase [Bacteroidota bacterium]
MKRILVLLLLAWGGFSHAQSFNNEWIDYSKTYFKFFVGSNGLYRINQSALAGMGIGNTPAEHFQLWRNGEQVPMYTSVASGPLGASDFLEFWGLMNDGRPDKVMYRNPEHQLNEAWSLETDTAAYFLTVNPAGNNLRLLATPNTLVAGATPEPFFYHTQGVYYKQRINPGYAAIIGSAIYSSNYDQGEGWASTDVTYNTTRTENLPNLFPYTGTGANSPILKVTALGNALNPRRFSVSVNGTQYDETAMDYFDYIKRVISLPISAISGGTAAVAVRNLAASNPDRMALAQIELIYPRVFNFGGASQFSFQLTNGAAGSYLEISGFNHGGVAPILYDLTSEKRYVCDITTPGLVKVQLTSGASNRSLQLTSQATGVPQLVTALQTRNFVSYSLTANQGNYLMITHPAIMAGAGGTNPVEDYRVYRSSLLGGGHNAKIYLIDQLIDQFAFGIRLHPLSVRNFIRYARANFSSPVKNVLLIGKGVEYTSNRNNLSNPDLNRLSFVPTFGNPASDILLAANPGMDVMPKVSIGRLSVINAQEVKDYLDKVIQYEQQLLFNSPLIRDKAWTKNIVHVVGASDEVLGNMITAAMNGFSSIARETFYGANVNTFSKMSSAPVEQANGARLYSLFEEGIGMLTYFGHSSASTLEFNLDDPDSYNNQGKYPVFVLLGCNAGNFYTFNIQRLFSREAISEKFVLAPNRGSIATIAGTGLGITNYLDISHTNTLRAASVLQYGKTLGEIMRESISQTFQLTTQEDYFARVTCEQSLLHGDPALNLMGSTMKPDYALEDAQVKINPSFISVADPSFSVEAVALNLGKAVSTNMVIEVKQTFPNNTTQVIFRDTLSGTRFSDTMRYQVPIQPLRDKGLNKITICLDADNMVDELFEGNNCVTKEFYIYEDEARPVFPSNFAIVKSQSIKLAASTANPFATLKQYRMEIDTTELFNSPLKSTQTISSVGGLLEFAPGLVFVDSTVYYWRVAPVPASGQPVWNVSSFIYLNGSDDGFGQYHYFQHQKSVGDGMSLLPANRSWRYDSVPHFLFVKNGVWGAATGQEGDMIVAPDGNPYMRNVCTPSSLTFNMFDPMDFSPKVNVNGQYGSTVPCASNRIWNFEFSYTNAISRKKIMDFMDSVQVGKIVVVRTILTTASTSSFIDAWKADTTLYGSGNSLYHKLKSVGFDKLDSFTSRRVLIFIYQKGNPGFGPVSVCSDGMYDLVSLNKNLYTLDSVASVGSPVFGPVSSWRNAIWRGTGDAISDTARLSIYGIRPGGERDLLRADLASANQNIDISNISAASYPKIQFELMAKDNKQFTPYQLRFWQASGLPVPEGALSPNILITSKDSLEVGEPMNVKVAFKNISHTGFDSLRYRITVTDRSNVLHVIPSRRTRPLPAGDTLHVASVIATDNFAGKNDLRLEVNPDNDQAEQFHFNNFFNRTVYVRPDSIKPTMDVTFDGIHILNNDIVSTKPLIQIRLNDNSRWMLLNDTSLMTVSVRYPTGQLRRFSFQTDTLRFIPAANAPSQSNQAEINFFPFFSVDGEYELIVTAKDRSQNAAGSTSYRVRYQIINNPSITNLINYPNPFTTQTAFVFTVTGKEPPSNVKIEIMTVTGRVVREITQDELGPLRVGRNMTDFRWDGTDQYGQLLANGIYLYRVIARINGSAMEVVSEGATERYFKGGYGKMYLMR